MGIISDPKRTEFKLEYSNSLNEKPSYDLKERYIMNTQREPAKTGEESSEISISMQKDDEQSNNQETNINEPRRSERNNRGVRLIDSRISQIQIE